MRLSIDHEFMIELNNEFEIIERTIELTTKLINKLKILIEKFENNPGARQSVSHLLAYFGDLFSFDEATSLLVQSMYFEINLILFNMTGQQL